MRALRSLIGSACHSSNAVPGLLVVLAAGLVYLNSLSNGFVYDDHFVVVQNDLVHRVDLPRIFGNEYWSGFSQDGGGTYYRPLTTLSFALDYAAWGEDPFGFHLTNLILHAISTFLLYLVCIRLIRNRPAALFAALLFAVHPVHTEAVSNISGRSDLLFGVFGLTALLLYIRNSARFGTAAVVFLALCAKESALVLPALFLFCDLIWKPNAAPNLRAYLWKRFCAHHVWTLASVAAFIVLRVIAVGNLRPVTPSPLDNPLVGADLAARLFTLPALVLHNLRLLTFPARLSADYSFNQIPVFTSPFHLQFVLGSLVLFLAGLAVVRCWGRSRIGIFGVGLVWLPLALNLNPVLPAGSILAERYLYLPSAGFCLLVGLAALRLRSDWLARPARRQVCLALALLLLAAGAYRTIVRNRDWRNDEALFRSAVAACPNSIRAHLNLALLLHKKGSFSEAVSEYRQILSIQGAFPAVHYDLAEAYRHLGQQGKALYHYRQAVRFKPDFVEAWTALGNLCLNLGKVADAERAFKTALDLSPKLAGLYNQLGVIYQSRGDLTSARDAYEKAISGNYHHPGVFCNLGVVYAQQGRLELARKAYHLALKLQPDLAIAHFHLANLYRNEGNAAPAIEHYRAFLQYRKDDPRYIDQARKHIRSLDPRA